MRLIISTMIVMLLAGCAQSVNMDEMHTASEWNRLYYLPQSTFEVRSEGVVAEKDGSNNYGWRLAPGPGETQFIMAAFGDLMNHDGLDYQWCGVSDWASVEGTVFTGVADYSAGRWVWQDMSKPSDDPDTANKIWFDLSTIVAPISEDGTLYFIIVAHDGGTALVQAMPRMKLEFVGTFLTAPELLLVTAHSGTGVTYNPGPDALHPMCGGLEVWSCDGDVWDENTAENLFSIKDSDELDEEWEQFHHINEGYNLYALRLIPVGGGPASVPASEWSNVINLDQ